MKRRDIIKSFSAAVGGVAFTAPAAASSRLEENPEHAQLRDQYTTLERVRTSFEAHGSQLLEQLADEGLLDAAAISEFESVATDIEAVEDHDEIKVMSTVDDETGEQTAVLRVTEEFEGGKTEVFVMPEVEQSYARIEYDSGETTLKMDGAPADGDVTTNKTECEYVETETECTSDSCDMSTDCENMPDYAVCRWTFNEEQVYEVSECTSTKQTPEGLSKKTWTSRKLVDSYCSTDCCSEGIACKACIYGGC